MRHPLCYLELRDFSAHRSCSSRRVASRCKAEILSTGRGPDLTKHEFNDPLDEVVPTVLINMIDRYVVNDAAQGICLDK